MDVLVTYDVNTETKAGKRRLRQVARTCLCFGNRVQKSVFECSLEKPQLTRMLAVLAEIMDERRDSLRVYRLGSGGEALLWVLGRDARRAPDLALVV